MIKDREEQKTLINNLRDCGLSERVIGERTGVNREKINLYKNQKIHMPDHVKVKLQNLLKEVK